MTAVMAPVIVIGRDIEMADGRRHDGKKIPSPLPPRGSSPKFSALQDLTLNNASNSLLTCKE